MVKLMTPSYVSLKTIQLLSTTFFDRIASLAFKWGVRVVWDTLYIENDRTKKEREIQKKILGMARAEKEKNEDTEIRVGYWKIQINGIWYKWIESKGKLEKQVFQERKKREITETWMDLGN